MDTAKVIKRQLSYCLRGAETDAQRAQVQWWLDQVGQLAPSQPPADEQAATEAPAETAEAA